MNTDIFTAVIYILKKIRVVGIEKKSNYGIIL